MGIFTYVIIIWAIYKLITSLVTKKGTMKTPRNLADSLKLPEGSSIREVIQGISRGTWREQLKQAMENGSYQAGSLKSPKPMALELPEAYYVETEGTQGIEGTQGTEGTSEYVGILGAEAYKSIDLVPSEEMSRNRTEQGIMGGFRLPVTEKDLVQGVMWAEILGKPRAMHPYRGPRT
jgi:hypothetical protein